MINFCIQFQKKYLKKNSIEIGVCHDEGMNWGQSIVKEIKNWSINCELNTKYNIFILGKGFFL